MLKHLLPGATVVAICALAMAAPFAIRKAIATEHEVNVKAGGGETGYAVNLFLPSDVTVNTGDTVTWGFDWFEPHSVTYGTPTGDPTMPSVPLDAAHEFDGSSYFSSGLLGEEFSEVTTFSVTFMNAGNYDIYCAIHPFMTSTVNVVDSGTVDTQEELDARGAAEYGPALAELKTLQGQLAAAPFTSTDNGDGTKTWNAVVSGATMSGDVMQFFPPSAGIKAGDTLRWTNSTPVPHTVTFNMQEYPGGDPFAVPRSSNTTFDGTGFTNSGIIGVDFPDGTSYALKFSKAGTYNFVCILHANQGMAGTVTVGEADAPQPPATGMGTGGTGGINYAWYLAGAILLVAGSVPLLAAARRS
jgi:plastocyanin